MPLADSNIDEQIAEDWKAILDKHTPETDEVETEVEPQETPPVDDGKDERPRDANGKFVKAQEAEATEAPSNKVVAPKEPTEKESVAVDAAPDAPQRDISRPPSTWKPVVRGEWEKLTPSVRAEIHRREADFQNGQAQLLPDARFGSEMRKVVDPYRMVVESAYGTPERAMQEFLKTASMLQMGSPQQKLQTIASIAQQFGIDLSPLAGNPQQTNQQQPFLDPRVDQLLAYQRQQDQERQQKQEREIEHSVNRWINEKDAAGNPLRPYVGDVFNELRGLIPQIRQADPSLTHMQALEQAYDRAVWANPDVRAALQEKQQSELMQKQRLESQERVRDAKRAASVNVPRRASTPSPAKPGTIEETIEATARELGLVT